MAESKFYKPLKHLTMPTETKKPLWKVLNEQRTQGEWHQFGYKEKSEYLEVDKGTIAQFKFGVSRLEQAEDIVNAKYTALAVNNLHYLAEALDRLIRAATPSTCDSIAIDNAKEALNRIS